jgi:predicted RNA methylase
LGGGKVAVGSLVGDNRRVARVVDPEGEHLAALRRLGDFRGQRVLELGCGDGRLTLGVAAESASVLAFDPDAEAVGRARRYLPIELAQRVRYQVASGKEIEVEPGAFDLALFSWSL